MIGSRFVVPLVASVGLSIFALPADAYQQNEDRGAEKAIAVYLSSQKTETEEADSQGSAVADLDGDGKSEIVLVWILLGPTYWHNNLTILTKADEGYEPVATLDLKGEAKLASVKGGIIFVEEKVHGKNDPICCPTLERQGKYRLVGKKIIEAK